MIKDYSELVPYFDFCDYKLYNFVTISYIEAKNFILRKDNELGAVKHLGELLEKATRKPSNLEKYLTIEDVYISGALAKALWKIKRFRDPWKNRTVEDLRLEIYSLAEELKSFENLSIKRQKEILDFFKRLRVQVYYYQIRTLR
ncbi:MAG: hypothetical protein QXG86_03570 [Candidatus Woesearchaeota archaeon]